MKVTPTKEVTKSINRILLPLVDDPEDFALTKANSVSFDLRTVPGNADSPKCKTLARVLEGTETTRQVVKWWADVMKVCIGLNVTEYAPKKAAVETMMRTGPLSLFRNCLDTNATNAFNAAWEAAPVRDPANPAEDINGDRTGIEGAGVDGFCHVDHVGVAVDFVVQQLLPHKALARVKQKL